LTDINVPGAYVVLSIDNLGQVAACSLAGSQSVQSTRSNISLVGNGFSLTWTSSTRRKPQRGHSPVVDLR
jgi:hypothetical protein